jgi:predicted RNA-binding Zn-ribbon protein involved in translation (DUF1610 family)
MSLLGELIKNLKRRKPAVTVCPKCGGKRIRKSGPLNGWILPMRYVCDDCGYSGYIIIELEKEEQQ